MLNDTNYSDQELIARLKDGDETAFDILFHRYYRLLWANSLLVVEDENVAKDIVQNFFIDFWRKKIHEKLEGDIKGYFYKAVYNSSLNYIKQKKNYEKHITSHGKLCVTAVYQKEQGDLESELAPFIQQLPTQQKRAFTLVYMQQLKYDEAALEMGVTINTIKTHLKSTLSALRKRIIFSRSVHP